MVIINGIADLIRLPLLVMTDHEADQLVDIPAPD